MIVGIAIVIAACLLAYANGANDNFKGVATLFGSGATNYRAALAWATVTTLGGSLCAIAVAGGLVAAFTGKGLVPDAIAASPEFALAVAIGAGLTVMLATLTGFPISTTHSLMGALTGAGLVAAGAQLKLAALRNGFVIPLLVSPLIATALAALAYAVFRWIRIRIGVSKEWCICVAGRETTVPISDARFSGPGAWDPPASVSLDTVERCYQRYNGRLLGVRLHSLLDALHFASAGAVCFARGLNDTPKIVALLVLVKALNPSHGMLLVATVMMVGGLLNARKVATTMGKRITRLDLGQGLTANLATSALVLFASRLGLPVSTTHVSCGALFGIGTVTGQADRRVIGSIVLSWVLTLPIAAALGAAASALLHVS